MAEDNSNEAPKGSAAIAAQERQPSARERADAALAARRDEIEANLEPANIGAAGATKIEASGAIMEDGVKKAVPVDHPAVDNNPRAGTTVNQNRIDFNDPDLTEEQAVRQNMEHNS